MNARELEVRCERCDAGFAIETRRCVHCNQRLARAFGGFALDAEDEGEVAVPGMGGFAARFGPGLGALLLIALGVLSRACAGVPLH